MSDSLFGNARSASFGHARTGNVAFDELAPGGTHPHRGRAPQARRGASDEFDSYLRELRRAKDQEEFDRFMAERPRTNARQGNVPEGATAPLIKAVPERTFVEAAPQGAAFVISALGPNSFNSERHGLWFLQASAPRAKSPLATTERIYLVAERSLPLKIVENPRAKRLTLRIEAGGTGPAHHHPAGVVRTLGNRQVSRPTSGLAGKNA